MFGDPLVIALVALVACAYASVGHGGASGYLAVFTLLGGVLREVVPVALLLNIVVASIATVHFVRSGAFDRRLLLPFVLASVPAAWLGGRLHVPQEVFHVLLATALTAAALRLVLVRGRARGLRVPTDRMRWATGLTLGAGLGFLAGLTGIGGGVFLSPLLLLMRWTDARGASAVAAVFIVCNSAAGLAGNLARLDSLDAGQLPLFAAALAGGAIGSRLGSSILPLRTLERVLAGVLVFAAVKLVLTIGA